MLTLMSFLFSSDAVFVRIPSVTDATVFVMGLRMTVTKDLCVLESSIGQ